jgi:hypothetical protein
MIKLSPPRAEMVVVIAAAPDNVPVTPKALAAVQAAKTVAVPANVPVANAIPRFFCSSLPEMQGGATTSEFVGVQVSLFLLWLVTSISRLSSLKQTFATPSLP